MTIGSPAQRGDITMSEGCQAGHDNLFVRVME